MKKKNIKNNNKYLNMKRYQLNIKWILILFMIILLLSFIYVRYIRKLIYKNVYTNISELS